VDARPIGAIDAQPQVPTAFGAGRFDSLDRAQLAEYRLELIGEAVQAGPIVTG